MYSPGGNDTFIRDIPYKLIFKYVIEFIERIQPAVVTAMDTASGGAQSHNES